MQAFLIGTCSSTSTDLNDILRERVTEKSAALSFCPRKILDTLWSNPNTILKERTIMGEVCTMKELERARKKAQVREWF